MPVKLRQTRHRPSPQKRELLELRCAQRAAGRHSLASERRRKPSLWPQIEWSVESGVGTKEGQVYIYP